MHMHIWSWISVNAKRKSGKMYAGNLHEMKARKKTKIPTTINTKIIDRNRFNPIHNLTV